MSQRSWLDPKYWLETFTAALSWIGLFFATIVDPKASGNFIDAYRKKNDGSRAPGALLIRLPPPATSQE